MLLNCLRVGFYLLFVLVPLAAKADDLPRHAVIGITLAPVQKDAVKSGSLVVQAVTSGSPADAAAIRAGDILLEIEGVLVGTPSDFVARIASHLGGEHVSIGLVRDGREYTKTVTLASRPYETSAYADVIYSSVTAGGWRRRVIITRPKSAGKFPAVLLIGGLGCYSLDGALLQLDGYGHILTALAKQNFVTMRVEKSGEGDSEGPACTDAKATAELEAQGYIAGLKLLKSRDYVEAGKVFIFSHSLGPLLASLVLPKESANGVIAAETIGRSWFEYTLENIRLQFALLGETPDQVDAGVRSHEKCAHAYFVQHQPASEVSELAPACADMIASYAGMPDSYMQEIADIDLGKQWKEIAAPVLVIYGTSDPATSAEESRYLADTINRLHPQRAGYVEIQGMGHDFKQYTSKVEFLTRAENAAHSHPFDEELITRVLQWLEQQTATAIPQ